MVHEFTHYRQDVALIDEVNSNPVTLDEIGKDNEKLEKKLAELRSTNNVRIRDLYDEAGIAGLEFVSFHEAQANAISQLILSRLIEINHTPDRFAGTCMDNPYPYNKISLFQTFKRNVLESRRPSNRISRALSYDWLIRHKSEEPQSPEETPEEIEE